LAAGKGFSWTKSVNVGSHSGFESVSGSGRSVSSFTWRC